MDTQGPGALAWRAGPLLLLFAAAAPAETVRCSRDHAPPVACRMTDTIRDGRHRLVFAFGRERVTIVARSQTGWWAGTLNGRPAMGYERNRGNTVFSTRDLGTTFAWWYPGQAHGSY